MSTSAGVVLLPLLSIDWVVPRSGQVHAADLAPAFLAEIRPVLWAVPAVSTIGEPTIPAMELGRQLANPAFDTVTPGAFPH